MLTLKQKYINSLLAAAPYIRKEFGVESMRLFGSVARGEDHQGSDVDLCVEMPPKAFRLLALKSYLQDLLGREVDLVRRHPRLDSFLLQEIEHDGILIFP